MGCTSYKQNELFLLGFRAGCRVNGRAPFQEGGEFSKALIRLKVRCQTPVRHANRHSASGNVASAPNFANQAPRLADLACSDVRRGFRLVSGRLHFGEPGSGIGTDHQVECARRRSGHGTHRLRQRRLVHRRRVTYRDAQPARPAAARRCCRGRPARAAPARVRAGFGRGRGGRDGRCNAQAGSGAYAAAAQPVANFRGQLVGDGSDHDLHGAIGQPEHAARTQCLQRALVDARGIRDHQSQSRGAGFHRTQVRRAAQRLDPRVAARRRRRLRRAARQPRRPRGPAS